MPQPSESPETPALTLEELWPPFGLRIESPRLELRVLRETDFPAYAAAASSAVIQTSRSPLRHAGSQQLPEDRVRESLPRLWSTRSAIGPDQWCLMLGVFLKDGVDPERGQLIGMQDCAAEEWSVLRTLSSGSWLRAEQQEQGLDTEARAAMLLWAFDHFGAEYAESGAYTWDERSRRVAETLGCFTAGTRRVPDSRAGKPEWEHMFRLSKNDLLRPSWQIQVTGNERLRSFFGHG